MTRADAPDAKRAADQRQLPSSSSSRASAGLAPRASTATRRRCRPCCHSHGTYSLNGFDSFNGCGTLAPPRVAAQPCSILRIGRAGGVADVLVRLEVLGAVGRGLAVIQDIRAQGVGNEAGQPPGYGAPIEGRRPCDLLGMGGRNIGDEAADIGAGTPPKTYPPRGGRAEG